MNSFFFNQKNWDSNFIWGGLALTFLKKKSIAFWSKFCKKSTLVVLLTMSATSSWAYSGSCIGDFSMPNFFINYQVSDSLDFKVWVDFIEESDTAFVKGLVANLTEKEEALKWEMLIHKESKAGIFDEKLEGTFTAIAFSPSMVAETKIELKKREYFVITFKVFNLQNKLLGTDTLTSQEINPSIQPVPATRAPIVSRDLPKPGNNLDALEIDGLILDETRSKIGRDFYEIFYNRWTPPAGARDFLITIKEMPARGIGARVSIHVNEEVILYRFLQPRGDVVEKEANISISYVKSYLMKNENVKQDIEIGDQMGSGVY